MIKLLRVLFFVFLANTCFAQTSGIALDGNTGFISLCHDDNFNLGDGFTIEAWIFTDEWKTEFWQGSIINKDRHPQPAPNEGYSLRAGANGSLSFVIATGAAWHEAVSDPIMNTNQWYHVAGVYASNTASIFINGELVSAVPIPGTPSNNVTTDLLIGDSPGWPGRVFNGIIDEVRIWNVARTADQIADNLTTSFTGSEAGLVAYLPMEEGMGNITANLADNSCEGNLNQATWSDGFSIPDFDIGVLAITAPDLLSVFERPTKVQVSVQNYGGETVSSIPVELTINGLPSLTETFNVNLPPGEMTTLVMSTPLDLTGNNTNLISAKTAYADDGNDLNDGLSYRYKRPSGGTIVNLINEEQHNFGSAGQTQATLANLPENMEDFEQILIHFDVECPNTGCDPWDQTAKISVQTPDGDVEIVRFITPYGIECGPWTVDVTDFKSILTGPTIFKSFIQVFGTSGWLLNCDMEFVEGSAPKHSKLNPLWQTDYWVYGDPSVNDDNLPERSMMIADHSQSSHMRMTISGHGQGNTNNAAEFSNQTHQLVVNGAVEDNHNLWKNDCGQNPCANQGGNWTPSRSGWCPGQEVQPYTYNLTGNMTPGQMMTLDYALQDYTNLMNTGYNNMGHTEPHYRIHAYLVEESDTRYEDYNNLRAERIILLNDGTNFTGIDFVIKNTGSEPISAGVVSYYVDGTFIYEETLGAPILAGDAYTHSFTSFQGLMDEGSTVIAVIDGANDENVSDDATKVIADFSTKVETLTKEELNIFPNPSSGKFLVEVGESLLQSELEIIDIQGKVIQRILLQDVNTTFSIKEKGIYAISVKTEKGRALYGKVVVQ